MFSPCQPIYPFFHLPNVFVFPPEEDGSPPWCFFDAKHPVESEDHDDYDDNEESDIYAESALNMIWQTSYSAAPVFQRSDLNSGIVMPRRQIESREDDDGMESNDEFDRYGEENITIRANCNDVVEDDSEVIEVVTVSRRHQEVVGSSSSYSQSNARGWQPPSSPTPSTKRSKPLNTRVSRVFRAMKMVTSRDKPSPVAAPSNSSASPDASDAPSYQISESLSSSQSLSKASNRRGSILSQIFHPSSKSRFSFDSAREPPPPSSSLPAPSEVYSRSPSLNDDLPLEDQDDISRSPSPTPSSRNSESDSQRTPRPQCRFSVINLFSFTSSPVATCPSSTVPMTSSCDSLGPSIGSSSSSTASSSGPPTPIEMYSSSPIEAELKATSSSREPLTLLRRFPSFSRREPQTPRRTREKDVPPDSLDDSPVDLGRDLSVEMRLDSLHFDELSFDADKF